MSTPLCVRPASGFKPARLHLGIRLGLVAALSLILPASAAGQDPRSDLFRRFGVRVGGAVAFFVSRDQLGWLGFDRPGGLAELSFSMLLRPWLSAELGGTLGFFGSSGAHYAMPDPNAPGGLLAPWSGLRLHGQSRRLAPFLAASVGPGFTGDLVRPFLQASLGADIGFGHGASVGPVVGLSDLFEKDKPGASTNARFVWAGISFAYRPLPYQPPPKTRVVHTHSVERVVEHDVQTEPLYVPTPAPPVDDRELTELLDRALPAPSARVELLAPVLFAFDSDELEPLGVAMLHEVAATLQVRSDIALLAIQGYADKRGPEDYNRALSKRRAERVKEWLLAHGIASERLLVSEVPSTLVESGDSEPEHHQNRRVIFRVLRTAEPK